jgi:hypothetical protein
MIAAITLSIRNVLWTLPLRFCVYAGIVFYALYRKGDVRVEYSHGTTVFKLEAKDRQSTKRLL